MRTWPSILAICAGLMFWGVWRGEDLSVGPFDYTIDIAIALVWLVALILVAWKNQRRWAKPVVVGFSIPVSLVVGLYSGHQESRQAFNDCVENGETVRAALGEYYDENGRYPENLKSLKMVDLPGSRLLRGSILRYTVAGEGYELFFGDWLVSHAATESYPFTAHK